MRVSFGSILTYCILLILRRGTSLSRPEICRRDVLSKAAAAASLATTLKPSNAIPSLDSFTERNDSSAIGAEKDTQNVRTIVSNENPPPILSLPIKPPSISTKYTLIIPRVGYSFYKTAPDKAERCAALALRSGITHLDLATQYGSNAEVGKTIRTYLRHGREKLALEENPELIKLIDASYKYQTYRMDTKSKKRGRERRREELFLSHKISNEEQSTDPKNVRRAVFETIDKLGVDYLDMVSIHSPLTNSETRLSTYRALVNLQEEFDQTNSSPMIRAIGVCNYGLKPLREIKAAGLPLPAVNQLELSPFNGHKEVVEWCDQNGVAVSCAAWSKLSGANGPSEQWNILSQLSDKKGISKAQALVRWSLQKGFICVPRSGCETEIERIAIAENSYGGSVVIKGGKLSKKGDSIEEQSAILTPEEMAILDGLDVNYKAGRLGRTDGWDKNDIKGIKWDPTEV
mmetsp:Transcript_4027/g.10535  ORF Transcript_4027/g.10535 Transcript_4027/m.10535 type:complete len:460 (-) Transcript_4027:113-1492(-)|eukprot:CAMPEP_0197175930 /NCGR_PEP_ID=MMETSP1423-20130617/2009_1 /TAXON_ID=476441 /ORGANISM="Pseudo-nitzschia heimii, Strain UNC1101" /LENGTH=459 /DNA_ID=CAMNT_0042625197 /DNA_START=88 /DNA_END=1467 /DNA_ORIENTATION=-